ncbi:NAD(P)H-dependent oxidoreductase [Paenibacillus glycinis]|uniref:General stress protein n=1 Tax=Paenibacillus glycinis TaxID=2697035 RepID=A0ABW9XXZ1_9BACL|nr:NAD(P)H-dependent oxidoreductase [Paenibacillus glycinis]NBD27288.1 general stress protein [Paenibacillus glycinis]
MKTLVIVAHPNMDASRINKAWLEELRTQPEITIHELYLEYPDEAIDAAREQGLLAQHDRIIFQYPFYWYSTPPLLKKWFDLVLLYGWAYGPGGDKMVDKEVGAAISTYGSTESYQRGGSNLFTLTELLSPFRSLVNFIGADYLPHFALSDVSNVTDEQLAQSKRDYVRHVTTAKPLEAAFSN